MMKLRTVAAGLARGTLLGLSLLNIAIGAAVAAENEKPPQIPWDLNTLFKTPQFQPAADFDTDGVRGIFFDGLPWKGKPTRVFAFIGMPDYKAGEKVPAMVLIHGGGGTAFAKWVQFWNSRGYAAIAMDTCGSLPRGKSGDWDRHENGGPGTAPGGSGRFAQIDEPLEDQWTYHAVADAILANSLLRSMPDVDKDRVGLTGISWGGFVTCIVASLDDRFRFAAPVYGCGFIGDNSTWLPNFMGMGKEKAAKWLRYWDPSQYLSRAKIPFLWLTGSNDFAYPLDSYQKSYRSPAGERTLCVKVGMRHGHIRESENAQEICVFADHALRNGPALARITKQGTGEGKVWATFEATTPITKAELNFTRDTGDGVHIRYARVPNTRTWSKRTWETIPADLDAAQHKVTAAIPAGATVCYLNLIDDHGLVVSTEHVEAAAGAMEGEMMRIVAKTGRVEPVDSVSQKLQSTSGGGHLWWRDGQKPGDTLTLGFTVPQAAKQRVFGRFVKGTEFGIAQLAINDEKAGEPLDFYNDGVVLTPEIELGTFDLTAGENRLTITITGANEKAVKSHMVGLDYVRFEPANQPGAATDGELRSSVEQAWRAAWDRFHHDGTHLFYDFVCSHDPDKRWSGLPTPDEARRAYPNPNGWATGMEDCAISGGLMMAMVCDRFAATQDASLRPYAQKVFAGLVSLGTLGASDGFVIRGLCPADGRSHYPESSRDQYTWYVYGLWRYFHSPLSQPEEKTTMRRIIAAICARLERNVVAANGYRIGKDTGEFDSIVDKMWENQAHEVARLPMIYAIGADVTGDPHWQDLANRYAPEAAAKSKEESTKTPYALLQQQVSLSALYALEKTPALKQQWLEAMRLVADRAEGFLTRCLQYRAPGTTDVSFDWRTWPLRRGSGGYRVPTHPDSIKAEIRAIREPAEAALTLLLSPQRSLTPEQTVLLRHMIAQVDSTKVVFYGHYYTQAAFWKAVTLGHIKLPPP